jgi:glycine cleavage system pyridoxal-binding protein P
MRYLPHTTEDVSAMLQAIGLERIEDLFTPIPEDCRHREPLNLPEPLTEWGLGRLMVSLAGKMAVWPDYKVFMGAGSYEHHIPAALPYLLGRSEFTTAYTPYQPEISQGTLQAVYEYQTLTARLLGMEVSNASLYDGSSALAEALLMAIRIAKGRRPGAGSPRGDMESSPSSSLKPQASSLKPQVSSLKPQVSSLKPQASSLKPQASSLKPQVSSLKPRVAVSSLVHPHYRRVVETYLTPPGYEIVVLPRLADGTTDLGALEGIKDLAAVAIQSPNFFGCVEDLGAAAVKAHARQALLVASFTEPLAFGLLKNPGRQGADVACGEGQSLGLPRNYGGPGLGMFATKMKFVRQVPGRLAGKTTDVDGKRGFVFTLSTREQHIRREKATSNVCTNSSLCAVNAAMYMASLGGTGIRELARLNYDRSEYLKSALKQAGFSIPFTAPTFNEFVVRLPKKTWRRLLDKKIIAGLPLDPYYPELADHVLLCATEAYNRPDLDSLVRVLSAEC